MGAVRRLPMDAVARQDIGSAAGKTNATASDCLERLRLGHWFGTSAQFWLNLQGAYEIRRAEERAGGRIAAVPFEGCGSGGAAPSGSRAAPWP